MLNGIPSIPKHASLATCITLSARPLLIYSGVLLRLRVVDLERLNILDILLLRHLGAGDIRLLSGVGPRIVLGLGLYQNYASASWIKRWKPEEGGHGEGGWGHVAYLEVEHARLLSLLDVEALANLEKSYTDRSANRTPL